MAASKGKSSKSKAPAKHQPDEISEGIAGLKIRNHGASPDPPPRSGATAADCARQTESDEDLTELIYGDLSEGIEPVTESCIRAYEQRIQELEWGMAQMAAENRKLKKTILAMKGQMDALSNQNKVLASNMCSLFQTARMELSRKQH